MIAHQKWIGLKFGHEEHIFDTNLVDFTSYDWFYDDRSHWDGFDSIIFI